MTDTTTPETSEIGFLPRSGVATRAGLGYLSAGRGEPVVLLHGWGGFKEMWWSTMGALARAYHVVAFDWPGHGSPPLEPSEPVLETLSQLTVDLCRELSLSRITLVGHSMGGNVAARVALEQPELVSRLALVNAAVDARYLSRTGRLSLRPHLGRHLLRLNQWLIRPVGALGRLVPHDHGGGFVLPMLRRQYHMARVETNAFFRYLRALYEGSLGDRVTRIEQPTLVVGGERDPLVSPRQAAELAERIPHAHLRMLRGVYHCPMDERPEALNRALLEFLESHPL